MTKTHLKPTLSENELFSKIGPEAALTQHTPPPHIFATKMPPKYAIQWGSVLHKSSLKSRNVCARKLPESRGERILFPGHRKYGIRTQKYGTRTPPFMPCAFMPCEPFFLGVGVVFNLLTSKQHMKLNQPRNYDFRVSHCNLPCPTPRPSSRFKNCTHNGCQTTTTVKCNDREVTSQKLNNRCLSCI